MKRGFGQTQGRIGSLPVEVLESGDTHYSPAYVGVSDNTLTASSLHIQLIDTAESTFDI